MHFTMTTTDIISFFHSTNTDAGMLCIKKHEEKIKQKKKGIKGVFLTQVCKLRDGNKSPKVVILDHSKVLSTLAAWQIR